MASQKRRRPAPAVAGSEPSKRDRLDGHREPNASRKAAQSHFGFQSFRVLSDPTEVIRASIDPRLVGLLERIMRGGHDCAICQTTLNLNPESTASPGLLGFAHGATTVAMAACVRCVVVLGDQGAEIAMCEGFAAAIDGTVEVLQGGRA